MRQSMRRCLTEAARALVRFDCTVPDETVEHIDRERLAYPSHATQTSVISQGRHEMGSVDRRPPLPAGIGRIGQKSARADLFFVRTRCEERESSSCFPSMSRSGSKSIANSRSSPSAHITAR